LRLDPRIHGIADPAVITYLADGAGGGDPATFRWSPS
jgi:hypothetical protein